MATKKTITAEATFNGETKNGKQRFSIEGAGVGGSVYLSKKQRDALGDAEELQVTLTPSE